MAHGDYTWQILEAGDSLHGKGDHPLKDAPARIGSYYGFLADAFAKNPVAGTGYDASTAPADSFLKDGYELNYETSISGLRLFELLNWVTKGKYEPLLGTRNPDGSLNSDKIIIDEGKDHKYANKKENDIQKKIKESDLITLINWWKWYY